MAETRTAEVVIIGGGVTGASTAFHLTQRGVRDVVVVDKGTLASGGTGKSSACVRQHYSTAETCRMIRYSLDFFQHFGERIGGGSCGFRHTGYLLGVDDKMRTPMEASVALQRSVGIDTRLVSPTEMREIEPRLRADDFVAGCYEPASGYCNPVETAQGFARAARAAGARILEDTAVHRPARRGRPRARRPHRGRRHPRPAWSSMRRACGAPAWAPWPASSCRSTCAVTRSAS